jgi:hypothetical protein
MIFNINFSEIIVGNTKADTLIIRYLKGKTWLNLKNRTEREYIFKINPL